MDRYLRIRVDHLEGCLGCAQRLEALLRSMAGVADAVVDADTASGYAHYDPLRLTESGIRSGMRAAGYAPGPSITY